MTPRDPLPSRQQLVAVACLLQGARPDGALGVSVGDESERESEIQEAVVAVAEYLRELGNERCARLVETVGRPEAEAQMHEARAESSRGSLAQFMVEQQIPDGFYDTHHLLKLYAEHMRQLGSAPSRPTYSQRARVRLAVTLSRLGVFSAAPVGGAVSEPRRKPLFPGLQDRLVVRLRSAGIPDQETLMARITEWGPDWWQTLPKVGRAARDEIEAWLRSVGALETAQQGLAPTAETLQLLLEGKLRVFRTNAAASAAGEALRLAENRITANYQRGATRRALAVEVRRCALWLALCKRESLESLDDQRLQEYRAFLCALPSDWQSGAAQRARNSIYWRPFSGQPSRPTIDRAIALLRTQIPLLNPKVNRE